MGTLEVWLLAVALAMDCFTVSIACGIIQKRVVRGTMLAMALLFGFFQALMPFLGWFFASRFSDYIQPIDHWIAFGLLAFVGGKMLWDGSHPEHAKTLNPNSLRVILVLAFATSIDALAVGISFVCVGMGTLPCIVKPIVVIGFVSLLFSLAGSGIGVFLGRKFNWPVEIVGGIILILIGTKILVEHLNT